MIELTEEQKDWVRQLEKDFPHSPAGFALAMVELYAMNPEFFERSNIEQLKKTTIPDLPKTEGTFDVIEHTDPRAEEIQRQFDQHVIKGETKYMSIEDGEDTSHLRLEGPEYPVAGESDPNVSDDAGTLAGEAQGDYVDAIGD